MALIPDISRQNTSVSPDGFDCLDAFHRRTVTELGKLRTMLTTLMEDEAQSGTRDLACEVIEHFSGPARQHHQDEERYVFSRLIEPGDAETVQAIRRLQQDHGWLEEDWMELAPHLAAVASGQGWYDLDLLREGANVFIALSYDHIALEESLIYPQARALLGSLERSDMGRAMGDRRSRRNRSQGPARGQAM